jgi:hypothetical protein
VGNNLIFGEKEIAFLKELTKQNVEFMIVGLSAAALQGAPVVTQDVDLWFKDLGHPGIKKALKKAGGTFVPTVGLNPPMFAGEAVKLFDIVTHMHGLAGFEEEKQHSLTVSLGTVKVSVLSLEQIIKSKKFLKRHKDKLVLPVLQDALIAIWETDQKKPNKK